MWSLIPGTGAARGVSRAPIARQSQSDTLGAALMMKGASTMVRMLAARNFW